MTTEARTVQLVIIFLGVTVLLCVGGGFWLANGSKTIPDFLVAIGSGAIGALSGILSKTSSDPQVQEVQVMNRPANAVPVEDATNPGE